MTTSGTTTFDLTAREVIDYALKKINIVPANQQANASQAETARIELNVMLKAWQRHPSIWRLTETSVTPVANTASISLSTPHPYRVIEARYRDTSGNDLPMEEMTRMEYYRLPNKTTAGTPTTWYYDPQQSSDTLYIWPVLSSVTTETIRITYQRRYEDVTDLSETVDITQENLDVIGHNLAARLADTFGRKGPHIDRIIQRAAIYHAEMLDADRPEVIRFVPDRRGRYG